MLLATRTMARHRRLPRLGRDTPAVKASKGSRFTTRVGDSDGLLDARACIVIRFASNMGMLT